MINKYYHKSEIIATKNATKQESVPLDGIEYNSILEIYSHSLNSF